MRGPAHFEGIDLAPQGVMYDDPKQVQAVAQKIKTMAIDRQTMPPGKEHQHRR